MQRLVTLTKATGEPHSGVSHVEGEVIEVFEWFSLTPLLVWAGTGLFPGWSQMTLVIRVSGCRVGKVLFRGRELSRY